MSQEKTERGVHYPCALKSGSNAPHRVSFLHHGDDFLIVGTRAEVNEMTSEELLDPDMTT